MEYDESRAKTHVKKISKAWYDFKKAHRAANTKIKAKRDGD